MYKKLLNTIKRLTHKHEFESKLQTYIGRTPGGILIYTISKKCTCGATRTYMLSEEEILTLR